MSGHGEAALELAAELSLDNIGLATISSPSNSASSAALCSDSMLIISCGSAKKEYSYHNIYYIYNYI